MIPITERFLSDAGGWQALKQARSLQQMGRVIAAQYEPPLLEGRVREGEQEYRTGLKILSASKVENLCTCRESRQRGVICAHALAVGLEIIKPRVAAAPATGKSPSTFSSGSAAGSSALPAIPSGERPKFHLQVEGSLNYLTARLDAEYSTRQTTLAGSRFAHPAEEAAVGRLRKAGFTDPDSKGEMVLKGEPRILAFFAGELPRLQRDWNVAIGARFDFVTRDIERIEPKLQIRGSGENWFDLSLELGTPSGEQFSAADIQRLLQSGPKLDPAEEQKGGRLRSRRARRIAAGPHGLQSRAAPAGDVSRGPCACGVSRYAGARTRGETARRCAVERVDGDLARCDAAAGDSAGGFGGSLARLSKDWRVLAEVSRGQWPWGHCRR
ncbi:MAG: SWIM zinc finger family protein [Chthoniobacter sp.]